MSAGNLPSSFLCSTPKQTKSKNSSKLSPAYFLSRTKSQLNNTDKRRKGPFSSIFKVKRKKDSFLCTKSATPFPTFNQENSPKLANAKEKSANRRKSTNKFSQLNQDTSSKPEKPKSRDINSAPRSFGSRGKSLLEGSFTAVDGTSGTAFVVKKNNPFHADILKLNHVTKDQLNKNQVNKDHQQLKHLSDNSISGTPRSRNEVGKGFADKHSCNDTLTTCSECNDC